MFSRVKGTQDFLDLTIYNFILKRADSYLTTYHFKEIATPILESVALFKRSLGLYTDVVSKEMFTIASHDDHGDDAICLRPEATASMVRAFVENGVQQTPWKVFTHGPMFRYERPQKGRYRQFHQISMEIIGAASILQDAHFIKMLDRFFHEELVINDYALVINFLGCALDRKDYEKKLKVFLDNAGDALCDLCKARKEKNIMRVFDCKHATCQAIYEKAPHITDSLCVPCAREWQQLRDTLELLSVSFAVRPTLVRGLDYYNKTVFEFVSGDLGAQNAFCAGGRYDQLVADVGGKEDQPSVGAAIGMERLMLIVEKYRDVASLTQSTPLYVIIPMGPEQATCALLLADELQAQGLATEVFLENESFKSMMRSANKLGAAYVLIIGEEELKAKEVTIKNMVTSEQVRVPQIEVVNYFKK